MQNLVAFTYRLQKIVLTRNKKDKVSPMNGKPKSPGGKGL